MSIELPATSRHRRDMTERLLKATLSPNQTKQTSLLLIYQQCVLNDDESLLRTILAHRYVYLYLLIASAKPFHSSVVASSSFLNSVYSVTTIPGATLIFLMISFFTLRQFPANLLQIYSGPLSARQGS